MIEFVDTVCDKSRIDTLKRVTAFGTTRYKIKVNL